MKNILNNLPVFIFFILVITGGNSLKSQNTPYWLPPSFPQVETSGHSENPDEYYFLNTFGIPPDRDSAWLMILDSTGMPVYYQKCLFQR